MLFTLFKINIYLKLVETIYAVYDEVRLGKSMYLRTEKIFKLLSVNPFYELFILY